jgi:hypothetical protein
MNDDSFFLGMAVLGALACLGYGIASVAWPDKMIKYIYSDWPPLRDAGEGRKRPLHVGWRVVGLFFIGFGASLLWVSLRALSGDRPGVQTKHPALGSAAEPPGIELALFGGCVVCLGIFTILRPLWMLSLMPGGGGAVRRLDERSVRRYRIVGRFMGVGLCIGGLTSLIGGIRAL